MARIDEALTLQAKIKNKNSLLDDDRTTENGMKDSKIIEIEEEDYNIMSSVRLLKKYTRYFEVNTSKTFFGKLKETISYQENGKIVIFKIKFISHYFYFYINFRWLIRMKSSSDPLFWTYLQKIYILVGKHFHIQ